MSLAGLLPYLIAYGLIYLLRNVLGTFLSITAAVATVLIQLKIGIKPPLPASAYQLFAVFVILGAFLYITASARTLEGFLAPLKATVVEPERRFLLLGALILLPLLVGWQTWKSVQPSTAAPAQFRVVHPAPPGTINSHGEKISATDPSPLRHLEEEDPEEWAKVLKEGRRVYYQNCYFCHGDELAGDGHFAKGLNPRPINFEDATTIAMFTETFLFWRVAKGGPGLPAAATPWDSAMPKWDDFLTNLEMWSVIAYLYERTDQKPRAMEISLDKAEVNP